MTRSTKLTAAVAVAALAGIAVTGYGVNQYANAQGADTVIDAPLAAPIAETQPDAPAPVPTPPAVAPAPPDKTIDIGADPVRGYREVENQAKHVGVIAAVSLAFYLLVGALLRAKFAESWLAQGRRLAVATAALALLGACVDAGQMGGSWWNLIPPLVGGVKLFLHPQSSGDKKADALPADQPPAPAVKV